MKTSAVLQNSCWLVSLLAIVLNLTTPSPSRAGEVEDSAAQFARRYIDRLKSGEGAAAFSEMWDMETILSNVFGLMYLDLSPEEKTNTQHALEEFFKVPFANAKAAQAMSSLNLVDAKASLFSTSTAIVTLTIGGKPGQPISSTLLLSKAGKAWKILDQRMGNTPSMRAGLALMWAQGQRPGQNNSIANILNKATEIMRQRMETP